MPAYHDFDDEHGDDFLSGFAGPDPYVRQALDRLEASQAAQRQAQAAQQQALRASQMEICNQLLEKLAAEGFIVDPKIDGPDLAAQPTPAADVYALAATLYDLLAGRPPRPVPWPVESFDHLGEVLRSPVPRVPGVPQDLHDTLVRALHPDLAHRTPSASRLIRINRRSHRDLRLS